MISQPNLELVADVLALVASWAAHPVLRWVCPYRTKGQTLALIAATFSRVRGVPEPLPDQFSEQVRVHMSQGDII